MGPDKGTGSRDEAHQAHCRGDQACLGRRVRLGQRAAGFWRAGLPERHTQVPRCNGSGTGGPAGSCSARMALSPASRLARAALDALGRGGRGEDPADGARRTQGDPPSPTSPSSGSPKVAPARGVDARDGPLAAEAHVLPLLGRVKVSALTRADVERFARDVAAVGPRAKRARQARPADRARRRGSRDAHAGDARGDARVRGRARDAGRQPGLGGPPVPRRERERVLSRGEMARLGEALAAAEAEATRGRRSA